MKETKYEIIADNSQTIHTAIGSRERAEELANEYRKNHPENRFTVEPYIVGEKYGR